MNRYPVSFDYAAEINAARRRRRTRRYAAWLCVSLAAILLAVSFGCLINLVCSPLFSAIAINILIAGFWGSYFLRTRR